MRIFQNIVFIIYAVMYLPFFAIKQKWDKYTWERLGRWRLPWSDAKGDKGIIWVHAVSVGELQLAKEMIRELSSQFSRTRFILTVTTSSARIMADELENERIAVRYFPVDLSWVMRKIIKLTNPRCVIAMETEIWPNLLSELSLAGIPFIVANARLSNKAFPKYRFFKNVLRPIFSKISLCLSQSEEHAQRYREIGVDQGRIHVTGNMKYDLFRQSCIREENSLSDNPANITIIAASTHDGEDQLILESYQELIQKQKKIRLVIAARHLNRNPQIKQMIKSYSFDVVSINNLKKSESWTENQIGLIERWGILNDWYHVSQIVFVGGSLIKGGGGHNLCEPAFYGNAIIHGPYMENFNEMRDLFKKANASRLVRSRQELTRAIDELSRDPKILKAMQANARIVVAHNQGATSKNIEEIEKCYPELLSNLS